MRDKLTKRKSQSIMTSSSLKIICLCLMLCSWQAKSRLVLSACSKSNLLKLSEGLLVIISSILTASIPGASRP